LQQLRDAALAGGVDALVAGLSASVRAVTLAVDTLATGYYRVRLIIDERESEFEVARILGIYEVFQRARDVVLTSGWDADLQERAMIDLNRALERRRR
jgi:hypothetical protein